MFLENATPDSKFEGMSYERVEELYAVARFYYALKDANEHSSWCKAFELLYLPKKRLGDSRQGNSASDEQYTKIADECGMHERKLSRDRHHFVDFFEQLKALPLNIYRGPDGAVYIKLKNIER